MSERTAASLRTIRLTRTCVRAALAARPMAFFSHFEAFPMSWTRSHAFAFMLLLSSASFAAQASPVLLDTLAENREGRVQDITGPRTFSNPSDARIWLAQGRLRAALRMGDRVRMHDEDHLFSSAHPTPPAYEKPIALEFNNLNGRLYTLTEAGLYREDTAVGTFSQANPGSEVFLDFSGTSAGHLEPLEYFQDLKIWPGTDRVFLLTTHRIISVLDNGSGGLALANSSSWTTAMFPPSSHSWIDDTTSDTGFNSLKVIQFERLRLFKETADAPALKDHLIAVVHAITSGYGIAARTNIPTVVLLCDLGANPTDTPVFDSDPGADINYAFYLSAPHYPGGASFTVSDYNIFGFDTFLTGAYVLCGPVLQVQELALSGVLPRPSTSRGSLTALATHSLPELAPSSGDQVENLLADDLNPTDRFFVVSNGGFHTHRISSPTVTYVTADQPFNKGCLHDLLQTGFVSLPGDAPGDQADYEAVLTASYGEVDYVCKGMDVTTDSASGIPMLTPAGVYSMSSSDGGVILPHAYGTPPSEVLRDDVYLPTFGGVVKFEPDDDLVYRSNADAFQPALAAGDANSDVRLTEHISAGQVGTFNRDFLFTASAQGDFMAYRTDENLVYEPIQPTKHRPDQAFLPTGWNYSSDIFYSNDVALLDLQPTATDAGKYVVADLTRIHPTIGRQIALLAYHWNAIAPDWIHEATSGPSSPFDVPADGTLSTTITVAPNQNWIVLAHNEGFLSIEQDLANSNLPIVTEVATTFTVGTTEVPADVQGLTTSNTRVFAFLNPAGSSNSEIRIYAIDATTGAVTPTGYKTIANTAYRIVTGVPVGRSFRGRFDSPAFSSSSSMDEESVYFACDGYILRFAWEQGSGGPTTDTFTFEDYWRSDYFKEFQDCMLYTLTSDSTHPRVLLAVKDTEAFAVIKATR